MTEADSTGQTVRLLYREFFGKLLDDDADTPSHIKDNLFLGSIRDARDVNILKRKNIKHILSLADTTGTGQTYYDKAEVSSQVQLKYKGIQAHDTDDYPIQTHFDEAFEFLDHALKSGDNVLVHCAAGVSRSATIVIAYLMRTEKWGLFEASRFVHEKRPCVCPNQGFLTRLLEFEKGVIAVERISMS
eukprot:Colp12_sorted_trinity150504_noHs@23043